MALALNKTTLKQQRDQLKMFKRFLPSLDLKRQQLLAALKKARVDLREVQNEVDELQEHLEQLFALLGSSTAATRNLASIVRIQNVTLEEENIVGTMLPVDRHVEFEVADYSRMVTPFWVDLLIDDLKRLAELRVRQQVRRERVERLDHAARRITQRVNLFEKVLIPRAQQSIRKIVIFLSDEERAAVVRSKLAKNKHA